MRTAVGNCSLRSAFGEADVCTVRSVGRGVPKVGNSLP